MCYVRFRVETHEDKFLGSFYVEYADRPVLYPGRMVPVRMEGGHRVVSKLYLTAYVRVQDSRKKRSSQYCFGRQHWILFLY